MKWIADAYIEDYSRANYFVNLVMTFSPDVEVGSTVLVTQRRRSHLHYTPVRVLRVLQDYENSQTQIAGRTLFRHSRAPEAGGAERERPTIPGEVGNLTLADPSNLLWVAGGYYAEVFTAGRRR